MGNLVRRTTSVGEVGIVDGDITTTAVTRFLQSTNSRTLQNSIELSTGPFEQNSLDQNSNFLIRDENNPLVYGLRNLDRMAMIIGGKSNTGVMQFNNQAKPMYSTPTFMKDASISDAIDIVLQNTEMYDPIKAGVTSKLRYAIEFNIISGRIARDVKRGIRVFTTYNDAVYNIGYNAIVEWSNNG